MTARKPVTPAYYDIRPVISGAPGRSSTVGGTLAYAMLANAALRMAVKVLRSSPDYERVLVVPNGTATYDAWDHAQATCGRFFGRTDAARSRYHRRGSKTTPVRCEFVNDSFKRAAVTGGRKAKPRRRARR